MKKFSPKEKTMKEFKVILFDLDGTLLPMDQGEFMRAYFGKLSAVMAKRGYEPKRFINALLQGTAAMTANDGTVSNEKAYWKKFCELCGDGAINEIPFLEHFYETDFESVRESCGFDPSAKEAVRALRAAGKRIVLATNPLFPRVATKARIRWAGLSESDFELITTYENSSFTKPSLGYYKEILEKIGVDAEDCLMVGNDVGEDMVAEELGMSVFLVDECLINKEERDISQYPRGGFTELVKFASGKIKE